MLFVFENLYSTYSIYSHVYPLHLLAIQYYIVIQIYSLYLSIYVFLILCLCQYCILYQCVLYFWMAFRENLFQLIQKGESTCTNGFFCWKEGEIKALYNDKMVRKFQKCFQCFLSDRILINLKPITYFSSEVTSLPPTGAGFTHKSLGHSIYIISSNEYLYLFVFSFIDWFWSTATSIYYCHLAPNHSRLPVYTKWIHPIYTYTLLRFVNCDPTRDINNITKKAHSTKS